MLLWTTSSQVPSFAIVKTQRYSSYWHSGTTIENLPLISVKEMKKRSRGTCDILNDRKFNVTYI